EVVGIAAGKRRDDFEIMAGANGRQSRAAAAASELNVPGCHSGNEQRRAPHVYLLGLKAVFGEKALLGRNPQWRHAAIDRRIADHNLGWRGSGEGGVG